MDVSSLIIIESKSLHSHCSSTHHHHHQHFVINESFIQQPIMDITTNMNLSQLRIPSRLIHIFRFKGELKLNVPPPGKFQIILLTLSMQNLIHFLFSMNIQTLNIPIVILYSNIWKAIKAIKATKDYTSLIITLLLFIILITSIVLLTKQKHWTLIVY